MLRSMYSSVSGLKAQQVRMDVIGNNIANVNTVGFKQGDVYFKDMISQNLGSQDGSPLNTQVGLGVTVGAVDTKFTQGMLQSTGRETDFAIEGDGMFVVVSPDAIGDDPENAAGLLTGDSVDDLQYTRDGIFSWDSEGYLRSVDGSYVVGNDGKVVSKAATVDNEAEDVTVSSKLAVAAFNNYAGLEKQGSNNYEQTDASGDPVFNTPEAIAAAGEVEESFGSIKNGFVEMSNVDLASEFTNMIITSRAYQANSRTITTSDEMLQELVNLKR